MRTAMITGGGRGIGLAISRQLQLDGFAVSILGTSLPAQMRGILEGLGSPDSVLYTSGSLTEASDRLRFLDETVRVFGRVDLLVNNAGVAPLSRTDVLEMNEESYDRVMGVNLKGPVFLSQLVARHMLAQPAGPEAAEWPSGLRGMIINISSISSDTVSINRAEYCLSKAGVSMLTRLLAVRLAENAIPVYEVRPGVIQTDMTAGARPRYDQLIVQGLLPIKRWGQPEDVARAVSLLATGKLAYSTGECLNVDGGFHLRRL